MLDGYDLTDIERKLLGKMNKKDNFIEGLPRLLELSGASQEHPSS